MRWNPRVRAAAPWTAAAALAAAAGCGDGAAPAPSGPAERSPETEQSPWHARAGSWAVAVPDAAEDAQLAAAIRRARETAGGARQRWLAAGETDRRRWAVKWAAPTVDGAVEHVWVRPTSWTRHRIEGWLASPPRAELLSGRTAGELVSFPADELSDWVHFLDDRPDGRREGGYTIEVLESRFGRP